MSDTALQQEMSITIKDLWKTRGNITFTSRNTGIHYSTIYNWISKGKNSKEEPYYSFYKEYEKIIDKYTIKKTKKKSNKHKKKKSERINVSTNNNLSNNRILSKYRELYEKGLLTTEEFEKKKKELISNSYSNNKEETYTNIHHNERFSEEKIISVARNNYYKLLRGDIGVKVIVRQSNEKSNMIKLEIVNIYNPEGIYKNVSSNSLKTLNINEDNYNKIKNIASGSLIGIECQKRRGKVTLRILD